MSNKHNTGSGTPQKPQKHQEQPQSGQQASQQQYQPPRQNQDRDHKGGGHSEQNRRPHQ